MIHDPTIRLATAEDAAELARLLSPLGYPISATDVAMVWEAWVAGGNFALVVPGADSLLGAITLHRMVVLHRAKPVGRITSLAVDPSARGQGLGRALMQAAEDAMVKSGCGLLEVTSHVRRTEAHAFYRHMAYEQTSFRFAKVFAPSATGHRGVATDI
jgi:GNAT superfamily N-acetyltransferase